MPNRTLKDSICTSDTLAQLTAEEERFFYRLIVQCDDFGRFDARPQILLTSCFPLLMDKVTTEDITGWLNGLAKADLIRLYTCPKGRPYLLMTSWHKHQRRRAQKSKYPQPPAYLDPCWQMSADVVKRQQMQSNASDHDHDHDLDIEYDHDHDHDQQHSDLVVVSNSNSEPKEPEPQKDDLQEAISFAQKNLGQLGYLRPHELDLIRDWHGKGLPSELICRAIEIAIENGSPKFNYIGAICDNWISANLKTLDDLQKYERTRRKTMRTRSPDAVPPDIGQVDPEQQKRAMQLRKELAETLDLNKAVVK